MGDQPQGLTSMGDMLKEIMDHQGLTGPFAEIQKSVLDDVEVRQFLNEHNDQIDADMIRRDFSVLFEYVDQRDRANNGQFVVHRGYKPVLAFNDHQITVLYQPDEESLQQRQHQQTAKLVQTVAMSDKMVARASLTDFSMDDDEQALAVVAVINFIRQYDPKSPTYQKGLYIQGPYGVGKTHLMAAMANAFAQKNVPVTLVHFPSFINELKASFDKPGISLTDQLTTIKQVPILVIDDIGAESLSAWSRDDILAVILEYRMQNELPTFFTSNFSMDALEKDFLPFSKDGKEPVKADRLMQRIRFLASETPMHGQNKRLS
ncbi:primosomal protein DnaI [Weissella tructae]|uniref:DnaI protein n=2 Tax=Weissella TaxID=46255 RepID=A0A075TV79_9LACO|nr:MULTISPECIES: primosomal protein DnaI [Weissella]AIG65444.1 DnaI protein [Weissella tructae]AIM62758.1 DnaI protein [Weissella ceti]AIM64093.1 DnaI protein [Weissella ceti]ELA07096.1 primosomal protein DnaI [Weissella ceti NC36]QVV91819.1 primosomal protein DnaI [Weissella tructae]